MPAITTSLTERRKADRLAMARGLEQIAAKHGASAERETIRDELYVYIGHPAGLRCTVSFSRASMQPDVHVIPWNIAPRSEARLAPSFGDVNQYHFCKATHVARGWEQLAAEIERGLAAAADGSAFKKH